MTASLRRPARRIGTGIGEGRPRRWIAFFQFPSRRSDCRRHSGATTVTSQPRARTWSSIRATFSTRPSDVSFAPWMKKRTPLGVAGPARPVGAAAVDRAMDRRYTPHARPLASRHVRIAPVAARRRHSDCAGVMSSAGRVSSYPGLIRCSIEHDFVQTDAGIAIFLFVNAVTTSPGRCSAACSPSGSGGGSSCRRPSCWSRSDWSASPRRRRGACSSRSRSLRLRVGRDRRRDERAHPRPLPDQPRPGAEPAPSLLQPRGARLAARGRAVRGGRRGVAVDRAGRGVPGPAPGGSPAGGVPSGRHAHAAATRPPDHPRPAAHRARGRDRLLRRLGGRRLGLAGPVPRRRRRSGWPPLPWHSSGDASRSGAWWARS